MNLKKLNLSNPVAGIYLNEEKFPYLDKIYDSHNIGNQKYNVKLFKINQNELLKFLEDK